jgi:hypothetical protein
MSNEPENKADELITLIESLQNSKRRTATITAKTLDEMHVLAIDIFYLIERLETRVAYLERDGRETYRTIRMLQEAGLFDEEQYNFVNNIVVKARKSDNTFTDLDTIIKRNRASMAKECA